MLNRIKCIVIGVLFGVYALQVQAEEESKDWFQIEYIVFQHKDSDKRVLRYEDIKYLPPSAAQYQYLYQLGDPLSEFQLRPIDPAQADLGEALQHLKRSRAVRVFDQGAWQQEIPRESVSLPLKIEAGLSHDEERFELEGSLTIKRSRYMHADVNLFLSEFDKLPYTDIKDWLMATEEDRWPTAWLVSPLAYGHTVLSEYGHSYIPKNTVQLNQSRRVKDAEIHYIDHPELAMVVTIKKIEDPNKLDDEYVDAGIN